VADRRVPGIHPSSKIAGARNSSEEGAKFHGAYSRAATVDPISTKEGHHWFCLGSSALTDDARNKIDTDFLDLAKGFRDARIRIEGEHGQRGELTR